MLARLLLLLVRLAAALPPPPADGLCARLAVRLIRLYQRTLSRHTGRVCLFHPSCSHRAVALLEEHGWRGGLPLVRAQLERCGADYTLVSLGGGDAVLLTTDGHRFTTEEISAAVRINAG